MTTTLFAIFGIALVAAMAWVITRIVNIFVELEELHQRVRTTAEKVENLLLIVKKQAERVDRIEQTHDENMKGVYKQMQIMEDICELTRAVAYKVDEKCNIIDDKCNIIDDKCNIIKDKCNIIKETSAQKAKNERLAKYTELRANGLSIRNAGEEVGVSYQTAKRYEKQRKAQSNENGDN